jgi:hypothetical protein
MNQNDLFNAKLRKKIHFCYDYYKIFFGENIFDVLFCLTHLFLVIYCFYLFLKNFIFHSLFRQKKINTL